MFLSKLLDCVSASVKTLFIVCALRTQYALCLSIDIARLLFDNTGNDEIRLLLSTLKKYPNHIVSNRYQNQLRNRPYYSVFDILIYMVDASERFINFLRVNLNYFVARENHSG